jgi:hypothetical protein
VRFWVKGWISGMMAVTFRAGVDVCCIYINFDGGVRNVCCVYVYTSEACVTFSFLYTYVYTSKVYAM